MAALIRSLFSAWAYIMRAAPILLAVLLAVTSYFTALRAGIRLWDDSPVGSQHTPDYFVQDFAWLRVRQSTSTHLEMSGKLLTHLPADDTLTLTPVNAVRQKAGTAPLRINAQTASFNNLTGDLNLKDNVQVRRDPTSKADSFELLAPRMRVETDTEVLHAYDEVTMRRGRQELKSARLTVNNLSGEVFAQQQVFVYLPPQNKQDNR